MPIDDSVENEHVVQIARSIPTGKYGKNGVPPSRGDPFVPENFHWNGSLHLSNKKMWLNRMRPFKKGDSGVDFKSAAMYQITLWFYSCRMECQQNPWILMEQVRNMEVELSVEHYLGHVGIDRCTFEFTSILGRHSSRYFGFFPM